MRLINIAKSIKPFLNSNVIPSAVYKEIISNNNIDFLNQILTNNSDRILLCFLSSLYVNGVEINSELANNIKNNLFLFSVIEFGDQENDIECSVCEGNGTLSCEECYGNGYITCNECGGSGEVSCEKCDGSGEIEVEDEEYEKCDQCEGSGEVTCNECDSEGNKDCYQCDGSGNEDCYECDGRGTIWSDEYLPYEIFIYASYDSKLKDLIQYKIERNENIPPGKQLGNKVLLLNTINVSAGEDECKNVNFDFKDKTYYGGIITDDIDSELYMRKNSFISVHDFEYLPEIYED